MALQTTENGELIIKVAGHPKSVFFVGTGRWRCGHIEDGVSFTPKDEGGYVISFSDLIAIAETAANERGFNLRIEHKKHEKNQE